MILTPAVKAYLETLHAPQDDWLRGMREHGEREEIPIVHAETGALLELLVRSTNARHVVEVGTAIGVSTLHLARGGAHVTSFEIDPQRHTAASAYLANYTVDLRLQDADEGLRQLEPRRYDLAFIDGPKAGYADHLELCLDLLRPGGLLVVDNALIGGAVATREPIGPWSHDHIEALTKLNERILGLGGTVLPVGDGVALAVRRVLGAPVIDHVNNLKLQYLVELSKLGDECCQLETDVKTWLHDHDVVFGGETIPFVLMPHFISPGQLRRVRHAVVTLSRVLDRFCDAYPTDAALREELAVPDHEDELIRIDPGYPRAMRICRLDAFLQGYDIKFLEFNSDSPAGIGYTDILYEGLRTSIDLPRVRQEFDTAYTPMLPELIATLLDAYRHVREKHPDLPETPCLGVVDADGAPGVPEFRITCEAAKDAGIDTVIGTLDETSYDGTHLRINGQVVHLVYRRALLEDIGTPDLAEAARDGRICLVNPFRARVANNKKLLALFEDPRFAHLLDSDDIEVIRDTIPWTRVLREERTNYGNWTIDLLPFVADNRERLVLKPAADYGGHGVALGIETDADEWHSIIAEHAAAGDFIVQEYVPVPEEMFPTVEGGNVQMRLKRFNINPFGIGGRYAGSITRISDRAVINVSAGGGLLPSVIGRHKRRLLAEDHEDEEESVHGQRS